MNDLISRQDAIDVLDRLILPQTKGETASEEINRVAWRCAINCAEEMIIHLPSAQPTIDAVEVKHGEWEYIGGYGYQFRCSECIMCVGHKTKYCPNCGAKMDGEVKHE